MAHLNRARHVHVPGHVRVSQVCVWLLAGFTFTLELCCVQNQAPVCSGCSKLKDKGSRGRSERGGREDCADGARSVDGARRQPHLRHTHSFTTSHHRPGRQAGHWPQRRRPPRWVGGWGRSAVSHLATKADQWFAICPRRQNMIGRVRCIPVERACAESPAAQRSGSRLNSKYIWTTNYYYHNPRNLQHRFSEIYGNRSSKRSGRSSWSSIIEFI